MNTIEERAINRIPFSEDFITNLKREYYILGATEQKIIDEELNKSGEGSDGYHTFNELYYYRMLYNALWINQMDDNQLRSLNVHKSKKHDDGELCFGGGWFIVSVTLPTGQVTNHYELKYWDLFHCDARKRADKWDGHSPEEAAKRMLEYLKFKKLNII